MHLRRIMPLMHLKDVVDPATGRMSWMPKGCRIEPYLCAYCGTPAWSELQNWGKQDKRLFHCAPNCVAQFKILPEEAK